MWNFFFIGVQSITVEETQYGMRSLAISQLTTEEVTHSYPCQYLFVWLLRKWRKMKTLILNCRWALPWTGRWKKNRMAVEADICWDCNLHSLQHHAVYGYVTLRVGSLQSWTSFIFFFSSFLFLTWRKNNKLPFFPDIALVIYYVSRR